VNFAIFRYNSNEGFSKHVLFGIIMDKKTSYTRRNLISSDAGSVYFGGYIASSKGLLNGQMRVLGKYAFVFLISGNGLYRDSNGYNCEVNPGDVIFVTPTLAHQYGPQANQTWEEIYFVFDGILFDDLYQRKIFSEKKPLGKLAPIHHYLTRIKSLLERYYVSDAHLTFSILTEIQLLMAEAIAQKPIKDESAWSLATQQYIQAHLYETIDFEKLSFDMNLGYENFRKKFKKEFGMPPTQYQLSLLMGQACQLMTEANLNIKETALRLKFCDEFHFSKQFKKMVGVSPKEYIRLTQQEKQFI